MVGWGIFFALRVILHFSWEKIAASHWSNQSNQSYWSDQSDKSDQSDRSNLKVFHWQQASVISALEKKGAINKTTSAEVCIHHTKPHSSPKNNVWLTDKLTIMISNKKVKTANDKTATLRQCPPWDGTGHKTLKSLQLLWLHQRKAAFFLNWSANSL